MAPIPKAIASQLGGATVSELVPKLGVSEKTVCCDLDTFSIRHNCQFALAVARDVSESRWRESEKLPPERRQPCG